MGWGEASVRRGRQLAASELRLEKGPRALAFVSGGSQESS